jgi:hypothetical protein
MLPAHCGGSKHSLVWSRVSAKLLPDQRKRRPHHQIIHHPPYTYSPQPLVTTPHTTDIMDTEKLARMQNAARTGECSHPVPLAPGKLAKLMELPC